jgi:hypothetical protein
VVVDEVLDVVPFVAREEVVVPTRVPPRDAEELTWLCSPHATEDEHHAAYLIALSACLFAILLLALKRPTFAYLLAHTLVVIGVGPIIEIPLT